MASAESALRPHGHAAAFPVNGIGAASRILYVTPEISDFVKAGGLGDVSAALPRALRAARCDVRILAKRHPSEISLKVGFDEAEARCMFAGSDFLMMPSRFEPCGLSQMYAQRFGSLPIARRTGGPADSIEDGLTGFLFRTISVESCLEAVTRAFNAFGNRDTFMAMRKSAMARNFGWAKPALSYQQLYGRAIESFPQQRVA